MKTPEELAEEYAKGMAQRDISMRGTSYREESCLRIGFFAGYQAAKDYQPRFHAGADVYIIDANNPLPKPMPLSIAEQNQFADTSKVINSLEKPDGWISVKDRLPELVPRCTERSYSNDVLWLTKTGEMVVGNCRKVNELIVVLIPIGEPLITNFTHWMPLPKPPENK
jgi:hypothetical protein